MTTLRVYFKVGRMSVITDLEAPAHKILETLNKQKGVGFISFRAAGKELIAAVSDISHIEVVEDENPTLS